MNVLILDGEGKIFCGGEENFYRKGDSFMLTAGAGDWKFCGSFDAILTTVPDNEENF